MTAIVVATVRGRWFPAGLVFPGQPRPWVRCYALATDTDLHVWKQPGEQPVWSSPIQWARTTLPPDDRTARRGFDVHTDAGLVVVTLGSGCRCGSLGKWRGPSWATQERARR